MTAARGRRQAASPWTVRIACDPNGAAAESEWNFPVRGVWNKREGIPADPHDDRPGRPLRVAVVRRVAAARAAAPDVGEAGAVRVRHRARARARRALPGEVLPGRDGFIVLDVEIVFLYPFATVFRRLGLLRPVVDGRLRARAARAVRVPAVGRRARVGTGASRSSPRAGTTCCARSACPVATASTRADGRTAGRSREKPRRWVSIRSRTTSSPRALEDLVRWARRNSVFPATFGLACCAIEMMAHRRRALRPRALRHGGLPRQPAPGRPHDRRRPRQPEDGAGAAPGLRPDGRAQVGHLDGRVREQRRDVQQLRDRAGRRPDRPGRRVRARLPARSRDADARHPHPARPDPHRRAAAAVARHRRRGGAAHRARPARPACPSPA